MHKYRNIRKAMTRTLVFGSAILLVGLLCLFCRSNTVHSKADNIEAFAKVYGVVRWFYPGDEAQQVDWNKFATYGISKLVDSDSPEELKIKLQEVFAPFSRSVVISDSPQYNIKNINPNDTSDMDIVSWQHSGVGLGLWSNQYISKRTNRPYQTESVAKLAIIKEMPAANVVGEKLKVSVKLKNNNAEELKVFFKSAINNPSAEDYINFCVSDTSQKPIENYGDWKVYTSTLNINPEHSNSIIRVGIYVEGEGEFQVSDIKFSCPNDIDYENVIYTTTNHNLYNYYYGAEGLTISTKNFIFDDYCEFGEVATIKLAENLYAHIPLALYGTKYHTYPKIDKSILDNYLGIISTHGSSEKDLMLADIIVSWNVFKYFHPYLSDLNLDWDNKLKETINLALAYSDKKYHHRPLKLMTAALKDAHIEVNLPFEESNAAARYLPIRVQKINNELVVSKSISDKIEVGDIIESVNNDMAISSYESIEEEISGSPQFKTLKAEMFWLRSFNKENAVELNLKRNNKTFSVNTALVDREEYLTRINYFDQGRESGWVNENTIYLNLACTDFSEIKDYLSKRRDDQTVIIDLRNGTRFLLSNLLPLISDTKNMISGQKGISNTPSVIRPETPNILGTVPEISQKNPNRKNIFLAGASSYSHHEEVLDYVRYAGLGIFVGTNTGGCNGAINVIPLPSGGIIQFTGRKLIGSLGKSSDYYAIGIKPDIYIEKSIEDIKLGRDPLLDYCKNLAD